MSVRAVLLSKPAKERPNGGEDCRCRVDRTRVARRLGMIPRTLQRALAREGVTFKEVRDDVLWDGVHGLLANPECSVETIAMQAGFADSAAFSKAFKRRMGCSPSGYRKRLAG